MATHSPEPMTGARLLALMDEAGVDGALLIASSYEGFRNDYTTECAAAAPDRLRVMAKVDVYRPDLVEEVQRLWADPTVVGFRIVCTALEAGRLEEQRPHGFWQIASDLRSPVMVTALDGQFKQIAQLATRFPDLRLCLDHLGLTGKRRGAEIWPEIRQTVALAEHENLTVKATALPNYSTEDYPHLDLVEPFRVVVDSFGPSRVFWAADITRLRGTYADARRLVSEHLLETEQESRAVLGGSLATWLGWSSA